MSTIEGLGLEVNWMKDPYRNDQTADFRNVLLEITGADLPQLFNTEIKTSQTIWFVNTEEIADTIVRYTNQRLADPNDYEKMLKNAQAYQGGDYLFDTERGTIWEVGKDKHLRTITQMKVLEYFSPNCLALMLKLYHAISLDFFSGTTDMDGSQQLGICLCEENERIRQPTEFIDSLAHNISLWWREITAKTE